MKAIIALLALVAAANAGLIAAPATILSRAPAFDSAVIKSDRVGGNFAYSVAENHAYAAHTPIVQHVASPVAVSYNHAPVAYTSYAAPAYTHTYATHAYAHPAFSYGHFAAPAVVAAAPAVVA